MPERYSTNKPEDKNPRPLPEIEWNNRTEESYTKQGFTDYIPYQVSATSDVIRRFLSEVDIRKGPIERTVTTIVRLKAIDWSTLESKNGKRTYTTPKGGRARTG